MVLSYSPLRFAPFGSSVKPGSLTLMRHKMTFSHFSKDLIRPVSWGEFEWVIALFVNFLLLGQGESHKVGRGWIKRDYSFKTYLGLNSPV